MAINSSNKAAKTEWKRIVIPNGKLVFIYTNPETGKCSFSFQVADDEKLTFMVSSKLVGINADKTGYVVGLPVGEIELSQFVSKGKYNKVTADKIEDLGYPFAE